MRTILILFSFILASLLLTHPVMDTSLNSNNETDSITNKKQQEMFKSWLKDTLPTLTHYEVNDDSLGVYVTHHWEVNVKRSHNKYIYNCSNREDSLLISLHLDLLKDYHKQLPKLFKLYTTISSAYFVSYHPGAKYDNRNGFDEHSILVTDKDSVEYDFIHYRINRIKCYYNNGNDSIIFREDDYNLWNKMRKMYKHF